jgi:hypothetical protein
MAKRNGGIIGPSNVPTGQYGGVAPGVWRLRDAFNYIKAGLWPVAGTYPVGNSARFNAASSDYLNKTFGTATNRKIFTFSTWVKRSSVTGDNGYLMSAGTNASTNIDEFYFKSTNVLGFGAYESSVTQFDLVTTQLFRDVSAWYHVVVAYDSTQATSSNRIKMYVNGSQVTAFTAATYPSLNFEPLFNSATAHTIAANLASGGKYQNGYLSEYYFIDGQALTPSSFGQTDSATGIWTPLPYTGTYGTNGFYLKFANSAALGTDSSGNGNTFTVNNLTSVDQSTDTPTNNFATFNSIKFTGGDLTQGNLELDSTSASWKTRNSTIGVSTGKWYMEFKMGTILDDQSGVAIVSDLTLDGNFPASDATRSPAIAYNSEGKKWVNGTGTASYFATMTSSDVIGIALDMDNGTVQFYRNGSTTGNPINLSDAFTSANYPLFFAGALYNTRDMQANFGSPPYSVTGGYTDAGGFGNFSYQPPSGYYALCTRTLAIYG